MTITNSSKCIACGGYHYMDGLPCPMYIITDVPTVTFNEYSYSMDKFIKLVYGCKVTQEDVGKLKKKRLGDIEETIVTSEFLSRTYNL